MSHPMTASSAIHAFMREYERTPPGRDMQLQPSAAAALYELLGRWDRRESRHLEPDESE